MDTPERQHRFDDIDKVHELRLELAKDYASKGDLAKIEGKVESMDTRLALQGNILAVVESKLSGLLSAVNKIVWMIAAPLLTGTVGVLVWAARQMLGGG